MTKSEVAKLLAFVTAVYPNIDIRQGTVEAWCELLHDIPFDIAKAAMKKVLAEQEMPCLPAIGRIRAAALEMANSQLPTPAEAWGMVIEAVRRYGSYQQKEAMESLPAPVEQVVRWIGWREICLSEEPEVVRAQFMRMYDIQVKREREIAQMPSDVRQLIGQIGKPLLS